MSRFRRWRQQRARQIGSKIDAIRERGRFRQWFLLSGRGDPSGSSPPDATRLDRIYPPDDVFWADPFFCSRDGRLFLFFEEFSFARRHGHISAMALDAQARPIGEAVNVLEEPHHLSYPFLFEFEGELYMVPEQARTKRVDLYRCVSFPWRWERVKTLIEGLPLRDSTLCEHEGLWWLFCAARQGGLRANESLFAFYADNPLSDRWKPHGNNPVVRDFSRARPAGRVFRGRNGQLLRPSQDCVRRYGHGLNLSEILELSPDRYEERLVWHTTGDRAGGWYGLHHVDWHQGLITMDAQRLVPATAAPGMR